MKKIDLLVDLSCVGTFGTKLYEEYLYKFLLTNYLNKKILVLTTSDIKIRLKKNVFIKKIPFKNLLIRNLIIQFYIPFLVYFYDIKYTYTPFDVSYLFKRKETKILGLRNPTPFIKKSRGYVSKLIFYYLVYAGCQNSDKFITPTFFSLNLFKKKYKINKNQIYKIYHGHEISFNEVRIQENNYIIFISNFYFQKNLHLAIPAFENYCIENKDYDLKFIIIGSVIDKSYYNYLLSMIDNDFRHRIIFKFSLNRDLLLSYLKNSRFLFLPTEAETFCHPFAEAQNLNKFILCLNNSFSKEVCQNNAIYSAKSIRELSKNIKLLINNPDHFQLKKNNLLLSLHEEFDKTFKVIFNE